MVTQLNTPNRTPLAITSPMSKPRLKLIKQRAINPAIVVTELPIMDLKVLEIACPMARLLSPGNLSLFSR